jgi:hypothetical protein
MRITRRNIEHVSLVVFIVADIAIGVALLVLDYVTK